MVSRRDALRQSQSAIGSAGAGTATSSIQPELDNVCRQIERKQIEYLRRSQQLQSLKSQDSSLDGYVSLFHA
jgi:hypothetical protein